jgi:GTP cyclohydrolase I
MSTSEDIKKRILAAGSQHNYYASDNISQFIKDGEIPLLVDEVTEKFEAVLQSLVIDTAKDPNSQETAHRLAKMYINEIMSGRYHEEPDAKEFPNDKKYNQLIVVRCDIHSMCSHHHQPVKGVCYIGCKPGANMLGLSKYSRIVDHIARRGQLQEEMTEMIANRLMKITKSKGIGVYVRATHGCCEHRGIGTHNSTTQTTVLKGELQEVPNLKAEFMQNISIQEGLHVS